MLSDEIVMEQREYFHDLCMVVLSADKNIRFAGVIDGSGKLIVGEYRKDIQSPMINTIKTKESFVTKSSAVSNREENDATRNNTFAASKMVSTLNRQFESGLGQMNYHLTEYEKVKLLTVVLSNENSYYLCISMDPIKDCHPIISKVLKSI